MSSFHKARLDERSLEERSNKFTTPDAKKIAQIIQLGEKKGRTSDTITWETREKNTFKIEKNDVAHCANQWWNSPDYCNSFDFSLSFTSFNKLLILKFKLLVVPGTTSGDHIGLTPLGGSLLIWPAGQPSHSLSLDLFYSSRTVIPPSLLSHGRETSEVWIGREMRGGGLLQKNRPPQENHIV